MIVLAASLVVLAWLQLNVKFPENVMAHVEQLLRWIHFLAGITWIGILYFFNLVNVPLMKELDGPTKGKVIPKLMPRALWWFRWGAVVTVLAGLLYFIIYLIQDAANAPGASWVTWFGTWLFWWLVAWALIFFLIQKGKGLLNDGRILGAIIAVIVFAASWTVLAMISSPATSAKSLSISVGGGMGLVMLLNVWGIIWPAQKRIIAWTQANAEQGTPVPPESAQLARKAFLASRANFWLSFPMLFFMGASSHYPFLSGG